MGLFTWASMEIDSLFVLSSNCTFLRRAFFGSSVLAYLLGSKVDTHTHTTELFKIKRLSHAKTDTFLTFNQPTLTVHTILASALVEVQSGKCFCAVPIQSVWCRIKGGTVK